MKITALSAQVRNPDRVNVSIDGKYKFSLDITQIVDFGIKVGRELTETELVELEQASQFGKLYSSLLEYCLIRPRSQKEARDYLWRKTRATKYKSRSGQIKERPGIADDVAQKVLARLVEKGYIDDFKFASYWVENRNQTKGSSIRKLENELRLKGVPLVAIQRALSASERSDTSEIKKVITKKRRRYPDDQKLMQYLARQGFRFDDIKQVLIEIEQESQE